MRTKPRLSLSNLVRLVAYAGAPEVEMLTSGIPLAFAGTICARGIPQNCNI